LSLIVVQFPCSQMQRDEADEVQDLFGFVFSGCGSTNSAVSICIATLSSKIHWRTSRRRLRAQKSDPWLVASIASVVATDTRLPTYCWKMKMEAKTQTELDEIKAKINRARKWAWKYFNAEGRNETRFCDENLQMFPPSFFVEFPSPDTMRVTSSIMGRPAGLWVEYRLQFRPDGTTAWIGEHPLGRKFPPLVVLE